MSENNEISGNVIQFKINSTKMNDIEPVYSNHVLVIPTPNEVMLSFGRVDIPSEETRGDSTELIAKPVARIVLSHFQFRLLASLVARQMVLLDQIGKMPQESSED